MEIRGLLYDTIDLRLGSLNSSAHYYYFSFHDARACVCACMYSYKYEYSYPSYPESGSGKWEVVSVNQMKFIPFLHSTVHV